MNNMTVRLEQMSTGWMDERGRKKEPSKADFDLQLKNEEKVASHTCFSLKVHKKLKIILEKYKLMDGWTEETYSG